MSGQLLLRKSSVPELAPVVYEDIAADAAEIADSIRYMTTPAPDSSAFLRAFEQSRIAATTKPESLDSYLDKMQNFEAEHVDDVFLGQERFDTVVSVFKRMDRVQNLVGHGNFNVIGFDEMIKYASRYESVGAFPTAEKEFIEQLFEESADRYGFFGEKVVGELTAKIPESDIVKVPRTGHFLYRGKSYDLYQQLRRDVGGDLILTSGIRSIVKQSHLFLAKTIQSKGNLSRASRSLAPPGHSFHGIGDFDVGKIGLGSKNFSAEFARTDEFKKLVDLGFVDMRYPEHNLLGVRYEPWHIKVV